MVPQPHGNFLWHMGFQSVPDVAEALLTDREAAYLNNMLQRYAYNPDAVRPDRMQRYVEAATGSGWSSGPPTAATPASSATPIRTTALRQAPART